MSALDIRLATLGIVASLAALTTAVAGQTPARVDSVDFLDHPFAAVAVSAHPWGTAVALTFVLPRGSAEETRELPGAARLLGEATQDALQRRLSASGASVSVRVERGSTTFQVLTPPGKWLDAYRALVDGLFTPSLDFGSLEEGRTELLEGFRFERGAPIRDFQAEVQNLLTGPGSAWSRDPRGTPESLPRIAASDLADLKSRLYRREDASVTIVGALDAEPGTTIYVRDALRTDAAAQPSGAAWAVGTRQRLVRDVTNAWIGAAFPARRDVPRTLLEFIAQRFSILLNPTPRDPGLFGTDVRIEDLPDGPVIVVEAAVLPEDQARWEGRIVATLATIAGGYEDPALFPLHRRRFRNSTLTAEAAPEVEGLRLALDLLRMRELRDLAKDIQGLQVSDIVREVAALGEPRILVFGPAMGGG